MGSNIANIKSTSAAELPTEPGLQFMITESGSWLLDSTIEATALEASDAAAPPVPGLDRRPARQMSRQMSRQASRQHGDGCVEASRLPFLSAPFPLSLSRCERACACGSPYLTCHPIMRAHSGLLWRSVPQICPRSVPRICRRARVGTHRSSPLPWPRRRLQVRAPNFL